MSESVPLRGRVGLLLLGPDESQPRRCRRRAVGAAFQRRHPEKLKTWKPELIMGLQLVRISGFQIFTSTTGTGGGRPCTVPRADTQADFFIAEEIRSEAVLLASMRVCWLKWLYLSVTFGDAWPSRV
jgi:hypothetical protein